MLTIKCYACEKNHHEIIHYDETYICMACASKDYDRRVGEPDGHFYIYPDWYIAVDKRWSNESK